MGQSNTKFEDLLRLVETLRDPGGCPWDAKQTHQSLRPYFLEETYEALEAMDAGEPGAIAEELGDILAHAAFHIDIARRAGEFDSAQVISGIIDKLVRRHPHVFGEDEAIEDADQVVEQWEDLKRRERGRRSIVDSLPSSMPALSYAVSVWDRAAKAHVPLDGPEELDAAAGRLDTEQDAGKYLMAAALRVQAAGHDAETALRTYALSLRDRIRRVEQAAAPGSLAELPEEELRSAWERAAAPW